MRASLRFATAAGLLGGALLAAVAQAAGLTVNAKAREETRQFYRAVFGASEGVAMGFTGNFAAGVPGDTSAEFKAAVLLRINWYRAMAGVPGEVQLTNIYSAKDQKAALLTSANNVLNHYPVASAKFYSAEAAEACGSSNLSLGASGPEAITSYIRESGNNSAVGHRRWLFYPQTREMGTGDIPAALDNPAANAVWILDNYFAAARPATRDTFVAWPVAGYTPYQLVFPRWSISFPGADFSQAFVGVKRAGVAVKVTVERLANGYADNTLVWSLDGQDPAAIVAHPKPDADLTYAVEVSNVLVNGESRSFKYSVTVFDPEVAGSDAVATTVAGTTAPALGTAASYTVNYAAFASRFQWRSITTAPVAPRYDAENGLGGLTVSDSAYSQIVSDSFTSGRAGYRLAHPMPLVNEQTLTLPGSYVLGGGAAFLMFQSRLAGATTDQVARVQVSLDDGVAWTDLSAQTGNGFPGETSFTARTLGLEALAGRTFRLRFNHTVRKGGQYFPQTTPGVGWYLDDIALVGVQEVTAGAPSAVLGGRTFGFTPSAAGSIGLQARAVLFDQFPVDWSAVLPLTVTGAPVVTPPVVTPPVIVIPPSSPTALLSNLSVRTLSGGASGPLLVGLGLSGAGTRPLLVRAVGPTLAQFGVTGVLADPQLAFGPAGAAATAQNDNWGGTPAIMTAAGAVGAFPLPAASLDAVLLQTVAAGTYNVQVTGVGGTSGGVLCEVYDAGGAAGPRLTNLSARATVSAAAGPLIVGFAVTGTGNKTVLIRAIGPTLLGFGVTDAISDPKLDVYQGGTVLSSNDNWGGNAGLVGAFTSVGAFPLAADSKDAVLILSLAPGNYTAQVGGVGAATGSALVEVYALP